MADERQHYKLATSQPLEKTPKGPNPGYKKGGAVNCKKGGAVPRKNGRGR